MSESTHTVRLGDLLTPSEEWIQIDAEHTYREVTVRLWGKGVVLRREAPGCDFPGARRKAVRPRQFILSRIDARNGAMGIVPESLDGAVVSNDFPVFEANGDRLLPEFLGWISRTEWFVDLCRRASEGTTNRVRLKEKRFLSMEVTLPSLEVQRQIVGRIDALSEMQKTALELRAEADGGLEHLLIAMAHREDLSEKHKYELGWRSFTMGDFLVRSEDKVALSPHQAYPIMGVLGFARGVLRRPTIQGDETQYTTLYRVRAGQLIYSRLKAFEGAFAIVPNDCDGYYVSNEFPAFDCRPDLVVPEFLIAYLKRPDTWASLCLNSRGIGARRERLHPDDLLSFRVLVPPVSYQNNLRSILRLWLDSAPLRNAQSSELQGLMPSVLNAALSGAL